MKKYRTAKRIMAWMSMASLLIAGTGCGRKEVSYENYDASITDNQASDNESVTDTAGGTLKESLGVGEEWRWSEDIGNDNGTVEVAAELVIPEVSQMYTVEVEKYFCTPEDKQRVLSYFFDMDSVKVDLENVSLPTKEHISKEIASLEDSIEELKQNGEDTKDLTTQIDALKSQLADAPSASDVSEDVGDYNQNFYIGSKDEIPFSLVFQIDEENNYSAWTLQTKDVSYFNSQGKEDTMPYGNGYLLDNNLCSMSSEEAVKQAETICEELGITHMKTAWISDLLWDWGQAEPEYNGYEIVLTRDINGVLVDNAEYLINNEDAVAAGQHPYDAERIVIDINDSGICYMCYRGILTEGVTGNAVKLLSYEQIKDVFREQIKTPALEYYIGYSSFSCLELNYVRVVNEENDNVYSYIPAWRLGLSGRASNLIGNISMNIWINAMDGTVIDMEKEGNGVYFLNNFRWN